MTKESAQRHANVLPYISVLVAVFMGGFASMLMAGRYFERARDAIGRRAEMQRVRLQLGQDLAAELHQLQATFFMLAPLHDQRGAGVHEAKIAGGLARARELIDVLDHGGSVSRIQTLNLSTINAVTNRLDYTPEPGASQALPAIELRPKLDRLEQRLAELLPLLGQLADARAHRNTDAGAALWPSLQELLLKAVPDFNRALENANNLLYDASRKVKALESEIAAQRRVYHLAEAGILVAIFSLAAALSVVVVHRVRAIVRRETALAGELREKGRYLTTVIESLTHPFWAIDAHTYRVLLANSAALKSAFNPLDKHCYEIIAGLDQPCHECGHACPLIEIEGSRRPTVMELVRPDTQGVPRNYELHGFPVLDGNGQLTQVIEYMLDITDRKSAEAAQRTAEARLARYARMDAIGLMAGGIAHDLNNILSGIVSFPELLLLSMAPDDPLREPLQLIHDSGKRASAIVSDLLTMTRGVASLREPADLNRLVDTFLRSPECETIRTRHPHTTLRADTGEGLLPVLCSPAHIQKILLNLALNAAEATSGNGLVTIVTANHYLEVPDVRWPGLARGEYVRLSVSDDGHGIPPEHLDHIFEPFFSKKKLGTSGTGLGLAIVWNAVVEHGGGIAVASSPAGTHFDILLPATRSALPPAAEADAPAMQTGAGQTVLVVDDDELQRTVATTMLNALHYTPAAVASGEEALAYLEEHKADVLLLDMIMAPGIDGCETYRRALEIRPGQRCIIASGFTETHLVRDTQRLGAGTFMRKPYSLRQLGQALHDELAKA